MNVACQQFKTKRLKLNEYKTQEMERNLYLPFHTSNVYKIKGFPLTHQNGVSANQLVTLSGNRLYELVGNYPINIPTTQNGKFSISKCTINM